MQLSDPEDELAYGMWLVVCPGESPELRLDACRHCLGVLRGDLVLKFFDCLRKRSAQGDARTF